VQKRCTHSSTPGAFVSVALTGSGTNLSFSPNPVEADLGSSVQFHLGALKQSLLAWETVHPCLSHEDQGPEHASMVYSPYSVDGDMVIDAEVLTSDVQYFFSSELLFNESCNHQAVFTLSPAQVVSGHPSSSVQGMARASCGCVSQTVALPHFATATAPSAGTISHASASGAPMHSGQSPQHSHTSAAPILSQSASVALGPNLLVTFLVSFIACCI